MDKIKLLIPFMSISVNWAYGWRVRRFKTNTYKEFENKMFKFFNELWERFEIIGNEWLEVRYIFYFPIYNKDWSIKKKDLENYLKTLNDSLSHHIQGFKDENIKHITLSKIDSKEEKIEIEILELI